MKLLIINSEYPPVGGGASNATANISRLMALKGNDVVVLTSRYRSYPKDTKENGVRILRGLAPRRFEDRSGPLEQLLFIIFGFIRSIGLIKKWRPTLIFAFFGTPSGMIALMLNIIYGIPYVISLRGGDVPGFRKEFNVYHKLMAPLLHRVWHNAEAVVANSKGLRRLALEFDSSVDIDVIPNGVDIDIYEEVERQWENPKLLIVGRIVHQKGIDILLEALRDLKELKWDLTIVGDGPKFVMYQELSHQFNLENRVEFVGWQNKQNLMKYYQFANLFVYPSRNEGMPNVLLEAMASGLPVLATNISGNEELVVPGKTGELVPPDSVDELKEKLKIMILDEKMREEYGRNARVFIENNFSWDKTTEQYLSLFKSKLEQN